MREELEIIYKKFNTVLENSNLIEMDLETPSGIIKVYNTPGMVENWTKPVLFSLYVLYNIKNFKTSLEWKKYMFENITISDFNNLEMILFRDFLDSSVNIWYGYFNKRVFNLLEFLCDDIDAFVTDNLWYVDILVKNMGYIEYFDIIRPLIRKETKDVLNVYLKLTKGGINIDEI